MKKKRQPAEPYRIKSIEPIRLLSEAERAQRIIDAHYNLFKLDANDIFLDLLTDSGTSAMSNRQWAALMLGDESYAGAQSFRRFEETVRRIFRKRLVVPCHQGRVAENLMFSTILRPGQYVLNNTHFDTTRGNVLHKGGIPVDLPLSDTEHPGHPFKGDMDTEALQRFIREHGPESIAMVMLTITNNSAGGHPVSLANVREVASICRTHGLLFYFDCARFAENCFFIKRDEVTHRDATIEEIAHELFDLCDGVMMSAKKDGLASIGGFLALNDEQLYQRLTELEILIEGFPTYGGMAGRDLDILAVGLNEVMDYDYLDFRIAQVAYFHEQLEAVGLPLVTPPGGHAVFIDAARMLPHIPVEQFPGQALAVAFYVMGGIRSVEIGSLMFGTNDPATGALIPARNELVRMALPRRVYTNSHIEFIAEVAERIMREREKLQGFVIAHQPKFLRHFTCDLVLANKVLQSVPKPLTAKGLA